jgi:hypothetical protein
MYILGNGNKKNRQIKRLVLLKNKIKKKNQLVGSDEEDVELFHLYYFFILMNFL